jgi:hypothetical protein
MKIYKNTAYFTDREEAKDALMILRTIGVASEASRIVNYTRGDAIQERISGRYFTGKPTEPWA